MPKDSARDRLRKLEELIAEKESQRKELEGEAKETERELLKAHRQLEDELDELRREREIRELSARVAELEAAGISDSEIVRELSRRGASVQAIRQTLLMHDENNPDHDHDLHALLEDEDLEELLLHQAPGREGAENTVYSAPRVEQQQSDFYVERQLYRERTTEHLINEPARMVGDEYTALRRFEEQERREEPLYQPVSHPLSRPNQDLADSIRNSSDLRIGGRYLREGE